MGTLGAEEDFVHVVAFGEAKNLESGAEGGSAFMHGEGGREGGSQLERGSGTGKNEAGRGAEKSQTLTCARKTCTDDLEVAHGAAEEQRWKTKERKRGRSWLREVELLGARGAGDLQSSE